MNANLLLFEEFDDTDYIKIFFDSKTGGFVVAHKQHGKNEFETNRVIALLLAKGEYRVILLSNMIDIPTPDASINDEMWEFKTISQATNLKNRVQLDIKKGKRQAANILIFIAQRYNIEDIRAGIYNAVKFDDKEKIQKIGILFQDGRLIIVERFEVIDKSYRTKFY